MKTYNVRVLVTKGNEHSTRLLPVKARLVETNGAKLLIHRDIDTDGNLGKRYTASEYQTGAAIVSGRRTMRNAQDWAQQYVAQGNFATRVSSVLQEYGYANPEH